MGIYKNFVEQNGTGTGDTILLGTVISDSLSFSQSFADGESVSYAIEDDAGRKVVGIGVFSLINNTITRTDSWSYNGAIVDDAPVLNILLSSGTHRIICTQYASQLDGLELLVLAGQPNGLATLDGSGLVPVSQLPVQQAVFGQDFTQVEDLAASSTTSTLYITKVTMSPVLTAGTTVRIGWSYNWAYDSETWNFYGRVTAGGIALVEHAQEPKDASDGSAPVGTDQLQPASGFLYYDVLTTGALTINLEWRSQISSINASMMDARLELWRVS